MFYPAGGIKRAVRSDVYGVDLERKGLYGVGRGFCLPTPERS